MDKFISQTVSLTLTVWPIRPRTSPMREAIEWSDVPAAEASRPSAHPFRPQLLFPFQRPLLLLSQFQLPCPPLLPNQLKRWLLLHYRNPLCFQALHRHPSALCPPQLPLPSSPRLPPFKMPTEAWSTTSSTAETSRSEVSSALRSPLPLPLQYPVVSSRPLNWKRQPSNLQSSRPFTTWFLVPQDPCPLQGPANSSKSFPFRPEPRRSLDSSKSFPFQPEPGRALDSSKSFRCRPELSSSRSVDSRSTFLSLLLRERPRWMNSIGITYTTRRVTSLKKETGKLAENLTCYKKIYIWRIK